MFSSIVIFHLCSGHFGQKLHVRHDFFKRKFKKHTKTCGWKQTFWLTVQRLRYVLNHSLVAAQIQWILEWIFKKKGNLGSRCVFSFLLFFFYCPYTLCEVGLLILIGFSEHTATNYDSGQTVCKRGGLTQCPCSSNFNQWDCCVLGVDCLSLKQKLWFAQEWS